MSPSGCTRHARRRARAARATPRRGRPADKHDAWPLTLSGGEAQRASLARALVREPDLLLLDEPFSALDALTRIRCTAWCSTCGASTGPRVLLVTHDVDEALLLADRVLVIDQGRVRHETVVRRERPRDPADLTDLRAELLGVLGVHEPLRRTLALHHTHAPPGESLVNLLSRPRLTAALVGTASRSPLAGCGGASNADAVRDDGSVDLAKVTLVVGDQKGGSEALLRPPASSTKLPYKVEWSPFTSGPPLLEAVSAGAVDIGGVGNTPPVFAADREVEDQGGRGATRRAPTGEAIVVPAKTPR